MKFIPFYVFSYFNCSNFQRYFFHKIIVTGFLKYLLLTPLITLKQCSHQLQANVYLKGWQRLAILSTISYFTYDQLFYLWLAILPMVSYFTYDQLFYLWLAILPMVSYFTYGQRFCYFYLTNKKSSNLSSPICNLKKKILILNIFFDEFKSGYLWLY